MVIFNLVTVSANLLLIVFFAKKNFPQGVYLCCFGAACGVSAIAMEYFK